MQAASKEIHNRGFYAYGPLGCALQANVDLWRKHFVIEEEMLEIDDVILTPEDDFQTSRYVDKFADWMCKDPKKGECLRANHLVRSFIYIQGPSFAAPIEVSKHVHGIRIHFGDNILRPFFPYSTVIEHNTLIVEQLETKEDVKTNQGLKPNEFRCD